MKKNFFIATHFLLQVQTLLLHKHITTAPSMYLHFATANLAHAENGTQC